MGGKRIAIPCGRYHRASGEASTPLLVRKPIEDITPSRFAYTAEEREDLARRKKGSGRANTVKSYKSQLKRLEVSHPRSNANTGKQTKEACASGEGWEVCA